MAQQWKSVTSLSNIGSDHMPEGWKDLPKEVASKLSYDQLDQELEEVERSYTQGSA